MEKIMDLNDLFPTSMTTEKRSQEGKTPLAELDAEMLKTAPTMQFVNELAEDPDRVTYEDHPYEALTQYAGIDCIATSGIFSKLWPMLTVEEPRLTKDAAGKTVHGNAPAIIDIIQDLEIPAHEFIIDLEINGMKYSQGRNKFLGDKMLNEINELDEKIWTESGTKFNPNSGAEIAE
jgi:DNA polymerase I-like protein with 3'-5' exonuclease and polymerase domains